MVKEPMAFSLLLRDLQRRLRIERIVKKIGADWQIATVLIAAA